MPFQIPPAAVSRFKFRLWNCRRSAKISRTAWLNKAIINIKRSRWKAVTALYIIVIANYPFEKHYILASLVKGRWIDGKAQVLILLLSACDMPIIFMLQTFCRQDGGIASPPPFAPHQPFQNRTIPCFALSHLPPLEKGEVARLIKFYGLLYSIQIVLLLRF